MRRFQQGCTSCYKFLCFCHRFTIRKLSKYGYCQTILQSHNFWDANREMFELKRRTKLTLPELYMEGNFFTTICKILILMFSLIIVYFLLIQQDEEFYLHNILNLVVPLLVNTFFYYRSPYSPAVKSVITLSTQLDLLEIPLSLCIQQTFRLKRKTLAEQNLTVVPKKFKKSSEDHASMKKPIHNFDIIFLLYFYLCIYS